jgi:hypothetical protein
LAVLVTPPSDQTYSNYALGGEFSFRAYSSTKRLRANTKIFKITTSKILVRKSKPNKFVACEKQIPLQRAIYTVNSLDGVLSCIMRLLKVQLYVIYDVLTAVLTKRVGNDGVTVFGRAS